jgi:hypothetical protein
VGDLTSRYLDYQLDLAADALAELVPAFAQLGKHCAPYRSAPEGATDNANVRPVGHRPTARADRPDLDLHAGHRLRHGDDERAHISADIEDDRALAGLRILRMRSRKGGGHGDVVPGIVW